MIEDASKVRRLRLPGVLFALAVACSVGLRLVGRVAIIDHAYVVILDVLDLAAGALAWFAVYLAARVFIGRWATWIALLLLAGPVAMFALFVLPCWLGFGPCMM